MNRIELKNVGPISNLELNIDKNVNIVIGSQASGKSTIAKAIYFCKKIRDYYVDFIQQEAIFLDTHQNEIYITFLKYIRRNYMGFFGTTKHMKQFSITYYYNDINKINIRLSDGYAKIKFSPPLEIVIKESFVAAYQLYQKNAMNSDQNVINNFTNQIQMRAEMRQNFSKLAANIFFDNSDILYIPAGRSLLAVMSEQLDSVDTSILDLPMKDFIGRIISIKKRFGTKLESMVEEYVKTVQGQVKNTDLAIAQGLIKKILRADYVNDADSEKLYFDAMHWVKLNFSSSGQQESLWILLLLFLVILENRKSFIIIEEPEAHLYPVAQKNIVELITLTVNSSDSQMFITTHSPYILSSMNLLIQSAIVENNPKVSAVEPVVKKQLRMNPHKIDTYKIREQQPFAFLNIKDKDSGMINSLEIDTISEVINEEAERLLELEIEYDL